MNVPARKTNAKWREVWLQKLEAACAAKGIKESTISGFDDFINRYLSPHSCHPGQIPEKAIQEFLAQNSKSEKQMKFCRDALTFFYMHVVESKKHIQEIKNFQLFLKENRNYAPRTVNLATAAIQFFYLKVLKVSLSRDALPRMKTRRPLPKVYSQEEVRKIILAMSNPKHRLILMLAYGCGLRLGELRFLKPEDFEPDRDIINIRQAKGKKDRIVMLDEALKPAVILFLKQGAGNTWFFEGQTPRQTISSRTIGLIFEQACQKAGVLKKGGESTPCATRFD